MHGGTMVDLLGGWLAVGHFEHTVAETEGKGPRGLHGGEQRPAEAGFAYHDEPRREPCLSVVHGPTAMGQGEVFSRVGGNWQSKNDRSRSTGRRRSPRRFQPRCSPRQVGRRATEGAWRRSRGKMRKALLRILPGDNGGKVECIALDLNAPGRITYRERAKRERET